MKRVRIRIPEPCHELWDLMTPTEKGAFCQQCSTDVRDFTHMSDEEIGYFLKYNSDKKTCGRFRKDQLERTYTLPIPPATAPRRNWLNLLLLVPLTLAGKEAFGQQKPPVCKKPEDAGQSADDTTSKKYSWLPANATRGISPVADTPAVIHTVTDTVGQMIVQTPDTVALNDSVAATSLSGKVVHAKSKAGLPLAKVLCFSGDSVLQAVSDSSGNFRFDLPSGQQADSIVVSLEGFAEKKVAADHIDSIAMEPLSFVFEWDAHPVVFSCFPDPAFSGTLGWTVTTVYDGIVSNPDPVYPIIDISDQNVVGGVSANICSSDENSPLNNPKIRDQIDKGASLPTRDDSDPFHDNYPEKKSAILPPQQENKKKKK